MEELKEKLNQYLEIRYFWVKYIMSYVLNYHNLQYKDVNDWSIDDSNVIVNYWNKEHDDYDNIYIPIEDFFNYILNKNN